MHSFNRNLQISVVIVGLCVLTELSVCQSKSTSKLEARVAALEQKIKMLETRMYTMLGGKSGEVLRVKMMMMRDVSNISSQANQYRFRPAAQNGGAGSFAGFTLAPKMAQTDAAIYTVTPSDTDVVIEGQPLLLTGKIRARVGYNGRTEPWIFTGDLIEGGNIPGPMRSEPERAWVSMDGEVSNIIGNAYQYRIRPRSSGGGGGSYAGYTIPRALASTLTGLYAAMATDSTLVLEARNKSSNTLAVVTADSAGKIKMRSTVFTSSEPKKSPMGPKTAADSIRENVTIDFAAIAARAYQYRSRPAVNGGGGGKYTDYLSAQTSSFEGTVRYELQVDPDMIILRGSSTRGLGSISAKVDANGKLTGWYYTGEFAK